MAKNLQDMLNSSNITDHTPKVAMTEDEAASVIQQWYRIERAYRNSEKVIGINPRKKSKANLKKLKRQLREGIGLNIEEKQQLNDLKIKLAKVKIGDKKTYEEVGPYLTQREKELYTFILDNFDWTLKHATPYYQYIKEEGGNKLLSLQQRKRLKQEVVNQHTPSDIGIDDNVFFTLGSPKHDIAGFLANSGAYEVVVDIKPESNDLLKGLWYGDHWYSYSVDKYYNPAEYGHTIRSVWYTQTNDLPLQGEKTYRYKKESGKILERIVQLGDETVVWQDVKPFIILNLILELRYIGGTYRAKLLNHPSLELVEPAIDNLFNSNVFDTKLPIQLLLDHKMIKIVEPKKTEQSKNEIELVKALNEGKIDQIVQLLNSGVSANIIVDIGESLLTSVICHKTFTSEEKLKLTKLLLDKGSTLYSVGNESPLQVAVVLGNYRIVKLLLEARVADSIVPYDFCREAE